MIDPPELVADEPSVGEPIHHTSARSWKRSSTPLGSVSSATGRDQDDRE